MASSVSTATAPSVSKRNSVFVWGGGGEPLERSIEVLEPTTGRVKRQTVSDTIFDHDLSALRRTLSTNPAWSIDQVLYGGAQTESRKLAAELAHPRAAARFDLQKAKDSLDSLVKSRLDGYSKGDQLLLVITTHGERRVSGEATHSVITADHKKLSLDSLQKLADIAAEKGVKLAIVDGSCHSGATVAGLKGKTLCTVSMAGDEVGWSVAFGPALISEMKPGTSLEEAYLRARSRTDNSAAPDQPHISTTAGRKAREAVKEIEGFMLASRDLAASIKNGTQCPGLDSPGLQGLFRDLIQIGRSAVSDDLRRALERYVTDRERALSAYQRLRTMEADSTVDRKRLQARRDGYRQLLSDMKGSATYVAQQERKAYMAIYDHERTKEGEPCRDFKF